MREFPHSEAGRRWGTLLPEYHSGGIASHSGNGDDEEASHSVLTVAPLGMFHGI